jgi:anti-sigma regulatory factor (Ser/Thr protein kinase)
MTMIAVPVRDASQVADARRRAAALATQAGTTEALLGNLALVVTELATNVLKHAGGGEIVVMAGDGGAVDVLALDRGPGMSDIQACLADGYSTAGTPGNGLGAVRRLSADVRMLSWPGIGTAVLARLSPGAQGRDEDVGALVVPLPGEEACGDAWAGHRDAGGRTFLVVDGLGHGAEAAIAAHAALKQFQRSRTDPPARIVEALHHAMRPTRGGAVAVARIDWGGASVSFAGIGNIAAATVTPAGATRRLVSHNGTAGHNARRIQAFDYPCADGLLVLHSDGISAQWSFDRYPGLVRAHPLLVAGVLYHHHARGRDDAAIVVARTARP